MSPAKNALLSLVALSALLYGCGNKEEPPPIPTGPQPVKPLKERTPKEQVQRLYNAAIDLSSMGTLSPRDRDLTLAALYTDYLPEPVKGGEKLEAYYERTCASALKAECDGLFPEKYKEAVFIVLLKKLDESLQALKGELPNAGLKDTQVALLSKEPNPFQESLAQLKSPTKGDVSGFVLIDHPVPLPERNSAVNVYMVFNEKGEVAITGKDTVTNKTIGPLKITLPTGNAPSSPPELKKITTALQELYQNWEETAKLEAVADSKGEIPAGSPRYNPVDGYIEISISPNAPGWYLAWAIKVCDNSNFSNPALKVRSTGPVPRLGMYPFPLLKTSEEVLKDPIKVKKGGEATQPSKPLTDKILAKLWPEDGATVQDVAKVLDSLGGCQKNPCDVVPNLLTVERWND